MPTSKTLAAKIAAVSKDLGAIAKTGHNKEQGFDFIEYATVSGKIRELFDKHGIAIIPQVKEILVTENVTSKSGRQGYHYILRMSFKILNADNADDSIERDWLGEATAYDDKGINKAETSGVKYFYMRTFNISEKGDADNDPDGQNNGSKSKPLKDTETDFGAIQATVEAIDDIDSLSDYYRSLDVTKKLPATQNRINSIINKRKKELEK